MSRSNLPAIPGKMHHGAKRVPHPSFLLNQTFHLIERGGVFTLAKVVIILDGEQLEKALQVQ